MVICLLSLIFSLRPIPYYDPEGRLPSHFEAFTLSSQPYKEELISRTPSLDRLVLIFVNAELYSEIEPELQTYLSDLNNAGYGTKLIGIIGGRAQNLRQTLQAHQDSGLVGTVMIGNLPVAWWEDSESGEDYPIDLFFSDLTGLFSDNDGDGKFDSHTGSTQPDIWVGRIHPSSLTYDGEVRLVKEYLRRNHLYRTGQLSIPHRGLVYNEVTWYPNDHGMSNLYSDVVIFNDANTTTAYHYKSQLRIGYEFVHLVAHSSPWAHTFFLAGDVPGGGSVFNFEIPALSPHACFYFLNACMCGRYLERDNLGNWYLFGGEGLVVIASTQLMYGINSLSPFYQALAHDSCFGDAFLKWHRSVYTSFRGTGILGDPTLKVNRAIPQVLPIPPVVYHKVPIIDWTEYPVDTVNFVNGNPAIGYSEGRIRIVFDSGRNVRSDNYISSFDGTRFTPPESIAWHEYYDFFSAVATDATGRFWVVWQSFRDYPSYEHFQLFSCYYHQGRWSNVRRVGTLAGYHDIQPDLVLGFGDTLWCAFKSWRAGNGDIWVSYEANGSSWSNPVPLVADSLDQIDPTITVDNENRIWVFWTSSSSGRWWIQGRCRESVWQPIFNLDTSGNNYSPRAITDARGRVWVIWHKWQNNQADVYYSYYDGQGWLPPQPLTALPSDEILPDITPAPDGTVWACWQSNQNGQWDIYVSYYREGWSLPQPVTCDPANDYNPVITSDGGGNIWVAWASDRRNYWNIYASVSPLTGVSEEPFLAEAGEPKVKIQNPLSGEIKFSLPGEFALKIYSVNGQEIASLSGRNETIRLKRNLRPGIYLVRILTKNFSQNWKLIVLK
jgi:hypothetical protein